MKKITIDLYNINELKIVNIDAYNKILEKNRQQIIDDRFTYSALSACISILKEYNLDIDARGIYYSVSYCQGDGVSFIDRKILSYYHIKNKSGDCNAFEKWILNNVNESEISLLLEYLNSGYNLNILKKTHNYCHAYTCIIDYETYYNDDPTLDNSVNEFIYNLCKDLFDNVYLEICKKIEDYLYSFYDVNDSDAIEYSDINNNYYDINGVLYE